MLDKKGKEIDAVTITTADHMHATCALACMQAGKHVYLESLISVEVIKQEGTGPFTFPRKSAVKYEFGPRKNMPPVTVYWEDNVQGDAYLPPGMSAAEARKIPGTG